MANMTKAEAKRILKEIEIASSKDLEGAMEYARSSGQSGKRLGGIAGAGVGALAGLAYGDTPAKKILGLALGGLLGGGAGYGIGAHVGSNDRKRVYNEVKRRKEDRISDLLSQLDDRTAYSVGRDVGRMHAGIQTNGTDYGVFVGGRGQYSGDDKIILKRDESGNPVLSLLFAGINSSVEDGGSASAHSPFAERFYNRARNRFSDVQANSVFDDPVVADAYVDKIVAKIMANRARTGKYPKIRVVGYSAGGRGIVNFLSKMRERDPNFKVDEIVGIDPYQFPWEGMPKALSDASNPVADKIVYSRLADNYTGSTQKGLGKAVDTVSNTLVSLFGKKLRGISANTVVENPIPGISHTDADTMYDSALNILSKLNRSNTEKKEKAK